MEWIRKALSDLNTVLVGVGQTVRELLSSKRAILGALAVAVPALASLFPDHKALLDQVLPFAEGAFAVLAVLDTIRPLGVTVGKG